MTKIGSLVGILLLALYAPLAQASLQIGYSIDGGAPVLCATGANAGPVTCSATVGDLQITSIMGISNSPGTLLDAHVLGDTLSLISTTAHTLDVWITAQDFTLPVTPPNIVLGSNLSITSVHGSGTVGLTSCVNTGNALAPPTNPFCAAGPSVANTTEGYSGTSANSDDKTLLISSLLPLYSVSQHVTIGMGANSTLNVITSTVLTPVPEASSLLLLGVFGFVAGLFRRRIFTA
jgi:hypothetical protein